jgi:ubiquinone/menaquinone biosynthesis C-methylase UbiE
MLDSLMSKNNDSGRVPAEERTPAEEPDKANLVGSILSVAGYGRLLEIGCTTGGIAEPLIRNGLDVWGLAIDNCCDAKGMTTIPGQLVSGSITRIPYADHSFGTVIAINCLCDLPDNDVPAVLHEIHRVCSRTFLVRLSISNLAVETGNSTSRSKSWWETALLEAGFRKHPAYYRLNTYESSGQEQGNVVLAYEKISPTLLARYPFHSLRTERDLHMDMLREHGSRSDAHVARYQLACKFVRPGDSVVDAASGLGYGSHVIQSQTKCASILGIDSSQNGIRYATDNFSREGRVRFVKGELPACLGQLPSGSVDCIISFETLEHIDQPQALLSEFHRLLSPGGRLIASVPHDWSDETGADPNPHHLHVYDRAKFTSQLG